MANWTDLKIGVWDLKITPIKPKTQEYQDVDETGQPVKRVKGMYERGYFVKSNGDKLNKAYKLINGKAMDKLKKTKVITKYIEVDKKEVSNFMCEKYYFVECDALKQQLNDSEKALKFGYTSGNGFKVYTGYISLFGNCLLMRLGLGYLSNQIAEIEQGTKAKEMLQELQQPLVQSAEVEDLIPL